MKLSQLVEDVKILAIKAGKVIMEIYDDESQFEISTKADDSPLTKADRAANEIICKKLLELTPHIPIISEENKEIPYEQRKDFSLAWLVDPVDGTKEFIKRNGEFTVNIALIDGHQVCLGVVYVPAKGLLYWAVKNEGAYRQASGSVDVVKLEASSFRKNDKGLRVVCSRSHLNEETVAFISALNDPEKVSKGSSLKFLVLAEGGAELYPRLAPTMEWDTGAAQIILEEAGGKVLQFDSQEPLVYNKQNLLNPFFLALGNLVDSSQTIN